MERDLLPAIDGHLAIPGCGSVTPHPLFRVHRLLLGEQAPSILQEELLRALHFDHSVDRPSAPIDPWHLWLVPEHLSERLRY